MMLQGTHNPSLQESAKRALAIGAAALCISAIGIYFDPLEFLRAYLIAYFFVMAIPLGSLAILMLHNLTGGEWGLTMRPVLIPATRMLPALAVLFLPIVIWSADIYPWMHSSWTMYLTPTFALTRSIFYFFIWIGSASLLRKIINDQRLDDSQKKRKLQILSAPGLLLYFLTMTFASIDWMMSLDAKWSSTIYGLIIVGGQSISALSFAIIILAWKKETPSEKFFDLGKLLLAFVMLWAYFAFSQYLIIWAGNLPDEISWFLARIRGGWEPVAILIVSAHFAAPFAVLLSQSIKKKPQQLALVAAALLLMRWIDTLWYIEPAFHPAVFYISWLHITILIALCGMGFAYFIKELERNNV